MNPFEFVLALMIVIFAFLALTSADTISREPLGVMTSA